MFRPFSLSLGRIRPLGDASNVDRTFHRVLVLDRPGVTHGNRVALHVSGERELDLLTLDRAGQLRLTQVLRGVMTGELLTFLLQRHSRRPGPGVRLDREYPFARDVHPSALS